MVTLTNTEKHEVVSERCVSCLDIAVFSLNQRQSTNPLYEEIKDSISHKGVQNPLHIAYHPIQKSWVLSQGGQTRLGICQELYTETNEDRFLYPPIIKVNFTSDLDLCVGHLVENELRGDTTFVEKSRAVTNIRHLIAQDKDGVYPTQEELAEQMLNRGMPIRRQSITSMLYTEEVLVTNISNKSFIDGLGRNVVDSIRAIRKKVGSEISPEDFDRELIAYINAFDGKVGLKDITDHFLPVSKEAQTISEISILSKARRVTQAFELESVVKETDKLSSGFLVKVPDQIQSAKQALVIYYLVSLSGVFNTEVNIEILQYMGIDPNPGGIDPSNLVRLLMDQLGLSELDVMSIPYQLFGDVDEETFEALVGIIACLRATKKNNL